MRRIVKPFVVDRATLWQGWNAAGSRYVRRGKRNFGTPKPVLAAREEARTRGEVRLAERLQSRRSVLSQLNTKAQTFSTIQVGITAFFGFVLFAVDPKNTIAIAGLGIGVVLSVIATGALLFMAIAGIPTKPPRGPGLVFLGQSRFDAFASDDEKCSEVDFVAEKRRSLSRLIARVAIAADFVAVAGIAAEAVRHM